MSDYISGLLDTAGYKAFKHEESLKKDTVVLPLCKKVKTGVFKSEYVTIGYVYSVPE